MITKPPLFFLEHIQESIHLIHEYLGSIPKEKFLNSIDVQDKIVRRLEIIGEAVKNLPNDLREKYNTIPWKDIAGLRDKLIHEYFSVDPELLWGYLQKDLPEFKIAIDDILISMQDSQ